ncbi:thiopeptide-type bacteriocin biosynthesis protein [Streptomyces muensis]|uniref:Thiopeptide-type bacteriocin biosynthesis protein n=1 Tax=Streptomyces muensis TaxID=1077944 RepID=A0A9X1PZD6_STRM4|nr:thiopeptide-type bacteriocin biosynthesis protein [Streptomyces muensis]MCF1595756.1 thiopeptide-type bacteriocin biosynthesis protein [Streptomyces muensis]
MGHEDTSAMENAVLSVLAGTPIEQAANRVRTSPARLTDALERYRAAGRAALTTPPAEWHQVNIEFADYPTAEHAFRAYLLPYLHTEAVGAWWFVRKYPCWRLRVRPAPDTEDTIAHLTEALDRILSRGTAKRWWPSRYEPETIAFGGPKGMTLTHALFHADSVGVLDYHQHTANGTGGLLGAKETSFLVTTLFLRAAGLELGEQGDVWGQVEARRPLPSDVSLTQISGMTAALRRLLTLDARAALADGSLTPQRTWITSMERGATALADAARAGSLQLGLRAILARHVLFHWNRMGFTNRRQAIWARAARQTTLGN